MELRIPPLFLVFLFAVFMLALRGALPGASVPLAGLVPVASALALAGALVCALGLLTFRRARTTVNPMEPNRASLLVRNGIYRYSRNPMYLGFALLLLAWGLYLANFVSIACVGLFVFYIDRYQIVPEERALASRFGGDYAHYKGAVRRWV